MALRFSDRIGKTKHPANLLKNELSADAENTLWSLLHDHIILRKSTYYNEENSKFSELEKFYRDIWMDFLKWPVDELPYQFGDLDQSRVKNELRDWYFNAYWYEKLNLIEYVLQKEDSMYLDIFNLYLKREYSAYRFVDKVLVEVTDKEEIAEVETALNQPDKFTHIKLHLKRALELLSDKQNPDYRNSIKESILAVESICKIITGDDNTTLGKALTTMEKKYKLPETLKKTFSSLYGYASNEGGIRHALQENSVSVDLEEARFVLITCSAFVNYLISKQAT